MATGSRFLLRLDLVTVQPAVGLAMAMADSLAAFLRRVREMDSRRAVVAAAVSFAARFWPVADLAVVVAFDLCRCSTRFATAGFVLAADPSDPAGFGFVAAAAAVAVAAVAVVDLFDLSVADLSVVVAGPDSVGSAAFAVDFASSDFCFAEASGRGRVVAVPFCSLVHRSSF